MQREDIEVEGGSWWTETLPIIDADRNPVEDLSGYEFQLQVRGFSGNLVGMGAVTTGVGYVRLAISPTLITAMTSGSAQLYRVKIRPIDQSWEATLKGGAIKKSGVDFPWQ